MLSNLPRASITPWLHAACLPFLKFPDLKKSVLVHVYETELSDIDFFKETTEILDVVFKKLTGVYYQV